jgi:hypothetical protein
MVGAYNIQTGELYAAWDVDPATLAVLPVSLAAAVQGIA